MGELINGRTPEKIRFNVMECAHGACLSECPYDTSDECVEDLLDDALALIQHLEAQQPTWISVKERLPEDCKDVLVWAVYHEEYGRNWALREVDAHCKSVGWENTADPDVREVTHWMPLPEPPKEER